MKRGKPALTLLVFLFLAFSSIALAVESLLTPLCIETLEKVHGDLKEEETILVIGEEGHFQLWSRVGRLKSGSLIRPPDISIPQVLDRTSFEALIKWTSEAIKPLIGTEPVRTETVFVVFDEGADSVWKKLPWHLVLGRPVVYLERVEDLEQLSTIRDLLTVGKGSLEGGNFRVIDAVPEGWCGKEELSKIAKHKYKWDFREVGDKEAFMEALAEGDPHCLTLVVAHVDWGGIYLGGGARVTPNDLHKLKTDLPPILFAFFCVSNPWSESLLGVFTQKGSRVIISPKRSIALPVVNLYLKTFGEQLKGEGKEVRLERLLFGVGTAVAGELLAGFSWQGGRVEGLEIPMVRVRSVRTAGSRRGNIILLDLA